MCHPVQDYMYAFASVYITYEQGYKQDSTPQGVRKIRFHTLSLGNTRYCMALELLNQKSENESVKSNESAPLM